VGVSSKLEEILGFQSKVLYVRRLFGRWSLLKELLAFYKSLLHHFLQEDFGGAWREVEAERRGTAGPGI
jgi:hypothetical protein